MKETYNYFTENFESKNNKQSKQSQKNTSLQNQRNDTQENKDLSFDLILLTTGIISSEQSLQ